MALSRMSSWLAWLTVDRIRIVEQAQGVLPPSLAQPSSFVTRIAAVAFSSLTSRSALPGMPTLSTFVLEVIVFTVLLFFLVFVWFGPLSIIAYRRRRNHRRVLEAQQQEQEQSAQSDVEKGLALSSAEECDAAAAAVPGCQPRPFRSSAPVSAFLRWRQRVLYQSDSLSELAVLPWYRREESASRRVLNFVLRKQSAQVSLTRFGFRAV